MAVMQRASWPDSEDRFVARGAAGLAVLALAAALVRTPPLDVELELFRALNRLPHDVEWVLWILQQIGSAMVLPIAALVLWRVAGRWQPAAALGAAGLLMGWLGAKGIKSLVGRGRPAAIVDDLVLGSDVPITEPGFPSGHAVLAFTLAVAFSPYLSRRGRILFLSLASIVALTRVYVGAHLPLDVVGGAGLDVAIGVVAVAGARLLTNTDEPSAATQAGVRA